MPFTTENTERTEKIPDLMDLNMVTESIIGAAKAILFRPSFSVISVVKNPFRFDL
jgi:hypothetical protein